MQTAPDTYRDRQDPYHVEDLTEDDEPEHSMPLGSLVGVVPDKVGEDGERKVVVVAVGTVEQGQEGNR